MSLAALAHESQIVKTAGQGGTTLSVQPAYAMATIDVETGPIRFRIDGGQATPTEGIWADSFSRITLWSVRALSNFHAVRLYALPSGRVSVIRVTYFGRQA